MEPSGWTNGPYESGAPSALVNRSAGLDVDAPSKPHLEARPPGAGMDDVDMENMAFLHRNVSLPPVGNAAEHLSRHAAFALSPLGQALPEYARRRLTDHMKAHVDACFPTPAERVGDFQQAANLARMAMRTNHA